MIKGTFLDEISHDIPHQNWGSKEWDQDFAYMKKAGIDMVLLIRCGYRKWVTYPSGVLKREIKTYEPSADLVRMFLELSEKYGFAFYFGLYDSGDFWLGDDYEKETDINKAVIEEVWDRYGQYGAFRGWYISHETSRNNRHITDLYIALGKHCKEVSGNLPVVISPYIDGIKNISQYSSSTTRKGGISLEQQKAEWSKIFRKIKGSVDVVAFQDGHVDYEDLLSFMRLNKQLANDNGIECWTNVEAFDRDMPIKFLPIKWDKLRMKLKTAQKAGIEKAIMFEFSHFMSPQSAYLQAGHLYNRYCEFLEEPDP